MKTTTKLYDMIEKEVNRLTGMMTLLSIILILSTIMLVISVIIIAAFRNEHFTLIQAELESESPTSELIFQAAAL